MVVSHCHITGRGVSSPVSLNLWNIIFTVGRLIGDSEFGPDEHRGATVYKCDGRANHPWPSPVCSDDDMTVMF